MSSGYIGQVTDRDAEMVSLLIRDPSLSLDELGAKLGVTKQAVAERKRRLEEEGFTKSFYFWNVSPRFECTKRVLVEVGKGHEQANRVSLILDRYNPVVVFFRTEPEEFFEGKLPPSPRRSAKSRAYYSSTMKRKKIS